MTDEQRAAYAIGYLRGVSTILWNLDGEKRCVYFPDDGAVHYDEQVDLLAKLVMKEVRDD